MANYSIKGVFANYSPKMILLRHLISDTIVKILNFRHIFSNFGHGRDPKMAKNALYSIMQTYFCIRYIKATCLALKMLIESSIGDFGVHLR